VTLNWGAFTQTVIDFLIIAFVIFVVVRLMNSMKRQEEQAPAPGPSAEVRLLTEIRDSLRRRLRLLALRSTGDWS
jgi:large conductance mechanosensitive channel